jgi:hypothetical protein
VTLSPCAAEPPAAPAAPVLDFGNHSSETITGKAWAALGQSDYSTAIRYAEKCVELFGAKALEMQKGLKAAPTEKEQIHAQWALNDVGTCYFIKGQALEATAKKAEAAAAYKYLADNLSFAQCWDVKGWFWKPADAAREKVKKLEFDSL